jgi:glycerol kinase
LTEHPTAEPSGLCRSIAWQLDETSYALEGNIRSSDATLAWLAEVLERRRPRQAAARAGHIGVNRFASKVVLINGAAVMSDHPASNVNISQ